MVRSIFLVISLCYGKFVPETIKASASKECVNTMSTECKALSTAFKDKTVESFLNWPDLADKCALSAGPGCFYTLTSKTYVTGKDSMCNGIMGYSVDPKYLKDWSVGPKYEIYNAADSPLGCVTNTVWSETKVGLCDNQSKGTTTPAALISGSQFSIEDARPIAELVFPGCNGDHETLIYINAKFTSKVAPPADSTESENNQHQLDGGSSSNMISAASSEPAMSGSQNEGSSSNALPASESSAPKPTASETVGPKPTSTGISDTTLASPTQSPSSATGIISTVSIVALATANMIF